MLFFEHKALYRRLRDEAPAEDHRVPIGSARIARSGSDVTVVTYGSGVDLALRTADELADEASIEVVDLRRLWPLDRDTVLESVARSSRLLVLQEAARSIGVANAVCSLSRPRGSTCSTRPRDPRADRHAGAVRRQARGRVPALGRSLEGNSVSSSPTDAEARALAVEPGRGARGAPEIRLALFRLVLLQRLAEERSWPLPAGADPGQRLHRARPGGGRRRRRPRARPRRRRRTGQPRDGLPLRPRRRGRARPAELPRPCHRADPGARRQHALRRAASATSSRSSRCSARSCPSRSAPRSPSSAATSRGSR